MLFRSAQVVGAACGVVVANLMFDHDPVEWSTKVRDSGGQVLGEGVATLGLLLVVFGIARSKRPGSAPFAVGAYITAAYFFTSSTSFANPAVTVARMLTHSFAGIAPESAPLFLGGQVMGGGVAVVVIGALYPSARAVAADLVVPHMTEEVGP